MSTRPPVIIGIGGTLREGSTSQKALRFALDAVEELGATSRMFSGSAINLSFYDPADPRRSDEALALVDALRHADGVIISSPSYHGAISGMLKNALDYTEDLRNDARIYLADRPVGFIVCADGIQAMGSTLATLRSIGHALRAWPTPFAATINSGLRPFDPGGGRFADTREQLRRVAEQVVELAMMRKRSRSTLASRPELQSA
jgi:FMN reductase